MGVGGRGANHINKEGKHARVVDQPTRPVRCVVLMGATTSKYKLPWSQDVGLIPRPVPAVSEDRAIRPLPTFRDGSGIQEELMQLLHVLCIGREQVNQTRRIVRHKPRPLQGTPFGWGTDVITRAADSKVRTEAP